MFLHLHLRFVHLVFFLTAVSEALEHGRAAYEAVLICVEFAAEFVHEQELHGSNASWNAEHNHEHHNNAGVKFHVVLAHIVDAVAHCGSAVGLLATGRGAIHATLIAKFNRVVKSAHVHPILLTNLLVVGARQGFVTPVPIPRHAWNIVVDGLFAI